MRFLELGFYLNNNKSAKVIIAGSNNCGFTIFNGLNSIVSGKSL